MKANLTEPADSAYQEFKAIDSGEYREKIRFVDRNKTTLVDLPVLEYLEVMDAYAEALFETGRYDEHLPLADHLVEMAIEYNIGDVNGLDLYYETLFQRAASLYNLNRLPEAMHVLQELLKIDSKHESTRLFLINCHVEKQKRDLHVIRKISMVLIFGAAAVIGLELLVIRSFLMEWIAATEFIRNTLFILGASILVIGELWIRYRAVSRVYDFTRTNRKVNDPEV
jgi:tetratricopeptide (TPR) repeat protein